MSYVDRIAEKIQPDALLHQIGLQRARETSVLSDTVLPALAIFVGRRAPAIAPEPAA